jgi:hypothetical protein
MNECKEKKADLLRWLGAWGSLPPEEEQLLPESPASPLPSPPAKLLKRLSHEIERFVQRIKLSDILVLVAPILCNCRKNTRDCLMRSSKGVNFLTTANFSS